MRIFLLVFLRTLQLFCLLLAGVGLLQIDELARTFQAPPPLDWTSLCWRILAVTIPLLLGLSGFGLFEFLNRQIQSQYRHAEHPWLANPMWAARHIRLNNWSTITLMGMGAAGYLGIVVPLAIATRNQPIQYFAGALGLMFLLFANMFWQNRKWNCSELKMSDATGVLGGPLSGVVLLKQSFPPGTTFEILLKCTQTTRSSKNQPARETTAWSSTQFVDKPLSSNEAGFTTLPINFAIPYECPSTTHLLSDRSQSQTNWWLRVQLKDRPNFGGSVFEVPVFRTEKSRPDYRLDDTLMQPYFEEVDPEAILARLCPDSQAKEQNVARRYRFVVWDAGAFWAIIILSQGPGWD